MSRPQFRKKANEVLSGKGPANVLCKALPLADILEVQTVLMLRILELEKVLRATRPGEPLADRRFNDTGAIRRHSDDPVGAVAGVFVQRDRADCAAASRSPGILRTSEASTAGFEEGKRKQRHQETAHLLKVEHLSLGSRHGHLSEEQNGSKSAQSQHRSADARRALCLVEGEKEKGILGRKRGPVTSKNTENKVDDHHNKALAGGSAAAERTLPSSDRSRRKLLRQELKAWEK
jgi:hypothetical protein